jgi:hypothetical protein
MCSQPRRWYYIQKDNSKELNYFTLTGQRDYSLGIYINVFLFLSQSISFHISVSILRNQLILEISYYIINTLD